jgi:hypothetical protein
MWTAVCTAFQHSQEISLKAMVLGQNALARDAAFQVVADAASLTKGLLVESISPPTITIFTADQYVLPYCQITDCHNNATACKAICNSVASILFMHPNTMLAICWILGKTSF